MKPFSLKSRTFGLGQTNWADKFWGICGIFGQTISTHIGRVSPLSIIQPLFVQKTKPLYPLPKYLFRWDWDLNLGPKELGIQLLCVRSLWFHHIILKIVGFKDRQLKQILKQSWIFCSRIAVRNQRRCTVQKLLEALGSRIGTCSVFCHSFSRLS